MTPSSVPAPTPAPVPAPPGGAAGPVLEVDDLADKEPERLKQLLKLWDLYVIETGVIPLNPDLGAFIEATEAQMPENAWMEYDYWKKGARDDPEKFMRKPPRFQRVVKQF